MTALLQSSERFSVHLYEKRRDYTRTRMVQLASYLVADSVASYCTDYIDEESVGAIFDPREIDEGLAFRRSIPPDLMTLLREWTQGFCPLNAIERSLSDLIDSRQSRPVERTTAVISAQDAMDDARARGHPRRLHRHQLTAPESIGAPRRRADGSADANTFRIRLEYALVVTFLYGQAYDCNELCKYSKNIGNAQYKFIPAVNRTYYDGSITHVTGIVSISAEDYERMPSRFDGSGCVTTFLTWPSRWTASSPRSRRRPTGRSSATWRSSGSRSICTGRATPPSREWRRTGPDDHPFARSPVFLVGDSAMGSPYFQSISLGFECAMFLAGFMRNATVAPGHARSL
jgi:hypothetical protein